MQSLPIVHFKVLVARTLVKLKLSSYKKRTPSLTIVLNQAADAHAFVIYKFIHRTTTLTFMLLKFCLVDIY